MLKLEKIYFYLGKKCILNDLNMNVEEGNIYGFLGANGSGKTTTIRIISEVFKPNIGKIIKNSKIQDKKKIGYLFHRDSLYESLSALDNLELFAKLYNINNKDQKISQLLKEVKLFDVKNDKVSTFSQGMKKRLSLSRVFLNNPYLAVLDEPFSGLDIEAKEWLINYILDRNKTENMTFIISSHDIYELSKICTKIGIISKGHIVKEQKIDYPLDPTYIEKLYKECQ